MERERIEENWRGRGLKSVEERREKGEADVRKGKEKEIKEKFRRRVRGMSDALSPVQIVEKDDSREKKSRRFRFIERTA